MKDTFQITCPKCKASFDAGSAFNSHFEKAQLDAEKKYKIDKEKNAREIEKVKIDAAKKAQLDAEKKYKIDKEKSAREIEKVKIEAAKKAHLDAEKKYKTEKESSAKEIEKVKKETELKANRAADERIKKEREKNEAQILQLNKREEILKDRVKKRNDEVNSLMKNTNSELKGEIQEENLQDFLRRKFPEDDLEEVKKGAKGGDCILTINHNDKKAIARIYFESKDTTSFNESWCNKLLKDMRDKGVENGIIVASYSCLPPDIDKYTSYVERNDRLITIIPMEFKIIHAVVRRVRSILILKVRQDKDHEVPDLMKKAWANLNSANFQLPIRSMATEIRNMEKIFDQERNSFERSSSNKTKTIKEQKINLVKIVTSFTSTVGDIFPEDILENETDKFIE